MPSMEEIVLEEEKRKIRSQVEGYVRGRGKCCAGCTVTDLFVEEESITVGEVYNP